jgi:hypothetical protein
MPLALPFALDTNVTGRLVGGGYGETLEPQKSEAATLLIGLLMFQSKILGSPTLQSDRFIPILSTTLARVKQIAIDEMNSPAAHLGRARDRQRDW